MSLKLVFIFTLLCFLKKPWLKTNLMLFLCFIFQFVFFTFWLLFLYDRELVYPEALDGIFPVWLNHAMVREEKI